MMPDTPSLNILQVIEPSGGGSGRHFIDLCAALTDFGHRVTAIYSPMRAEQRFVDEVKALNLAGLHAVNMTRSPSPSDMTAWLAINRIIAEHGPFDIIHGHSSKAGALTRMRRPGKHTPRVYTPHAFRTMDPTLGAKGRRIFGGIETLLGSYLTDALICVSQDEFAHAYRDLKIPGNALHLIVNGAAKPASGQKDAMRARLGVPAAALVYGFIGRLSEQKAPERLIRAFAATAAENPAAHLVMIGFGPLEDMVRAEIAQSGAGDRIHLTSSITGPEAMQAFDILVMPSRYEAMSYVMLEAEALGLPMVLTDVGGASTVLDDDENGFLVPNVDDISDLASAMARCADADCLARLRKAAGLRTERHSLTAMAQATEKLYRALARSARKNG